MKYLLFKGAHHEVSAKRIIDSQFLKILDTLLVRRSMTKKEGKIPAQNGQLFNR